MTNEVTTAQSVAQTIAMDPALHIVLRSALALLFASAALHKLRDLVRFRGAVASYELLPPALIRFAAVAFPLAETLLAGVIAAGIMLPFGACAAALLMTVYAAAIATNIRRGRTEIDCGCSGPAARIPLQPALVVRNALLAGASLLVGVPASGRVLTALDLACIVFATIALAASWQASERLLALAPRAAAMRAGHRRMR